MALLLKLCNLGVSVSQPVSQTDKSTVHSCIYGVAVTVFYPQWWLDSVGYFRATPNSDPAAILFASNPATAAAAEEEEVVVGRTVSLSSLFMACFVCAIACGSSGYYFAKKEGSVRSTAEEGSAGRVLGQFSSAVGSKVTGFVSSRRGYSSIDASEEP